MKRLLRFCFWIAVGLLVLRLLDVLAAFAIHAGLATTWQGG